MMQKSKIHRGKKMSRGDVVKSTSRQQSLPTTHTAQKLGSTSENRASVPCTPNPIDFDNFLPWVCREWSVSHLVTVIRASQEEDVNLQVNKVLSTHIQQQQDAEKYKDNKNRVSETIDFQNPVKPDSIIKRLVIIEAQYDDLNQLEQISFVDCRGGIPKKVIRAIHLCLPFHPKLTRVNICKGGLTPCTLSEITKILPHSNITILFLDNASIPHADYHTLIEATSQLSYLSLNKCRVNDNICKEIAINLIYGKPGMTSLTVLELASNGITDKGAHFLGEMLRTNRRLLHLNLAGNKITDVGAIGLITPLMEFALTEDEVLNMKRRRFKFAKEMQIYAKRHPEAVLKLLYEDTTTTSNLSNFTVYTATSKLKSSKNRTPKFEEIIKVESPLAVDNDFDCMYPYSRSNLVLRDGCYYAKGNLTFCSLNLAYNMLQYEFLKKLEEVLVYQQQQDVLKLTSSTGLLRIVMDGNHMPVMCTELDLIAVFLNCNVQNKQPKMVDIKKRQSSNLSKLSATRKGQRGSKQRSVVQQ